MIPGLILEGMVQLDNFIITFSSAFDDHSEQDRETVLFTPFIIFTLGSQGALQVRPGPPLPSSGDRPHLVGGSEKCGERGLGREGKPGEQAAQLI